MAPSTTTLLGPPEIYRQSSTATTTKPSTTAPNGTATTTKPSTTAPNGTATTTKPSTTAANGTTTTTQPSTTAANGTTTTTQSSTTAANGTATTTQPSTTTANATTTTTQSSTAAANATTTTTTDGRSYLEVLMSNMDKISINRNPPKPKSNINKTSINRNPPKPKANMKKTSVHRNPPKSNIKKPSINRNPPKSKTLIKRNPPKGLTENSSPTLLSTGNPCLDFFFHVVPDTPPATLTHRLQLAWSQDPLKALKLVCNLRGVRGTGKSDKEGYYTAALWLQKHHPKTLATNVASLADFGYFKDLPEILFRLLEGANARKLSKEIWDKMKVFKAQIKIQRAQHRGRRSGGRGQISGGVAKPTKVFPKLSREEKRIERAKKVVERFNRDPDFKFLHERVSDLFADCLRSDLNLLNSGDVKKISLAAKWCPSIDSSFDKTTLLCEAIARRVFPREEFPEYEGIEEAHYAYRVRDRLRKDVLVPLRKALELPEVYMGANDWGSLPYNRVASVAMKQYKGKFYKHDGERFKEYLDKVESGEAKIAAGALLPHEIIKSLRLAYSRYAYYHGYTSWDDESDDDGKGKVKSDDDQVAELQWRRMVEDMSKKGKLNNCLAVCDVSGSMRGTPMDVSVALGILVSDLSEEPWKGKVITFSESPMLQRVEGDSLRRKADFVRRMDWGMNTDFQKVFDLLLEVAVNGNLKGDEMIKRLFVFSDMEFDQACRNSWETDYEAIVRKFRKRGYGDCVPEIVFWNLRDSRATPVPSNQPGVALVSGFSKNLMKLFLEDGRALNPEAVMDAAISGNEYQKLVVVD